MKRSTVVIFAVAIALCAVSCQKEGVYKPGKKIFSVERVETDSKGNQTITPYEEWNWDGKLLKSITYHWLISHGAPTTETFTYEKNRLVSSQIKDQTSTYTYDGKFISHIETELHSAIAEKYTSTYDFEHNGNKISKITNKLYIKMADNKALAVSPLRQFLPENVCNAIACNVQKTAEKTKNEKLERTTVYEYTLTWDGDNVSKIECVSYIEGSESKTTGTAVYTYDKNPHPQSALYTFGIFHYKNDLEIFSVNNVLTAKITDSDEPDDYDNYEYQYTYDEDGYPAEYTSTHGYNYSSTVQHDVRTYRLNYVK